jgi:hypothetical protein
LGIKSSIYLVKLVMLLHAACDPVLVKHAIQYTTEIPMEVMTDNDQIEVPHRLN